MGPFWETDFNGVSKGYIQNVGILNNLYLWTYQIIWLVSFQTAMDQLHMHFTSAIHNTAFTIVLGYVELCSTTGDSNFQRRQYKELCEVSGVWQE